MPKVKSPWSADTSRGYEEGWDRCLKGIEYDGLYPWQKNVVDACKKPAEGRIFFVSDDRIPKEDGWGKSWLARWLEKHAIASYLPDESRVMQKYFLAHSPIVRASGANAFTVDIPYGIRGTKLTCIYRTVQKIADDPTKPTIVVFCHDAPTSKTLALDRWVRIPIQ